MSQEKKASRAQEPPPTVETCRSNAWATTQQSGSIRQAQDTALAYRNDARTLYHILRNLAGVTPDAQHSFEELGQIIRGELEALQELRQLVEKLGGREALQELLNFFGDWPQPWDEGDPGPARRAITLAKKYEEKFEAMRQLVHGTPERFYWSDSAKLEKIKELLSWQLHRLRRADEAAPHEPPREKPPCADCRSKPASGFCAETPCNCSCHMPARAKDYYSL